MSLLSVSLILLAGMGIGVAVMILLVSKMIGDTWLKGFREGLLCSADIAKDRADFELYDTEGGSGGRLDRARALFEVELQLRSEANQVRALTKETPIE